jgi:hypothetical protein
LCAKVLLDYGAATPPVAGSAKRRPAEAVEAPRKRPAEDLQTPRKRQPARKAAQQPLPDWMQDSMFEYGQEEDEEEVRAKKARRRPASKRKMPRVQLHPKGEGKRPSPAKKKGMGVCWGIFTTNFKQKILLVFLFE